MTISSRKNLFGLFLLTAFSLSFFLGSCKDKEPKTTKVYGTVTIDNAATWASWVDSGEVELTIFPAFSLDPLAGWGEIPDDYFGAGVPGGTYAVGAPYNSQNPVIFTYEAGKSTFDYEIELEPGTYSALALGFRHKNISDPTKKTATLGVHYDNPNQVSHGVVIKVPGGPNGYITIFNFQAPSAITIGAGEQQEINFKADFDFVNQWYQ
ncbi:MAG: hypothetical protein R3A50_12015 [Saprospiraceae bacterium]|nr:hypothetical protein [Saprospiraceae bacterium]MCB9343531.1 hypothetical protein [Lewinellaceae bacterium]